ncbi:MAG: nucleotidyltransferase family protein [Gammaproteobacteria bacterium]
MRVVLLAAGLGTRLRPLTNKMPKCLVPLGGRPLLEIWLSRLSEAGFGPFLINVHHLADKVKAFIAESAFRPSVEIFEEPILLGTAGTVHANLAFFQGGDGMVVHADNYCLADLADFKKAHEERTKGSEITMMTFETDRPSSCGVVQLDARGVVSAFYEKVEDPPSNLANAAVYIFSREILSAFPNVADISTEVIPKYLGRIQTYHTKESLIDIGTPQALEEAQRIAELRRINTANPGI